MSAPPRTDATSEPSTLGLMGRRWGSGEPTFVLVHGLAGASRTMAPLGVELRDAGLVLAPDLPGFGASATLPPLSVAANGQLLAERLRSHDGGLVLVGTSVGSQVVLHAARGLGDRLTALVLISPTGDPDGRTGQLWGSPIELLQEPAQLMRVRAEDQRAAGPSHTAALLRSAVRDDPRVPARELSAPTLVVRGSADRMVTAEWAGQLASSLPHGELRVLEDCGHVPSFTAAERLAAEIRDWLGRLTPAS